MEISLSMAYCTRAKIGEPPLFSDSGFDGFYYFNDDSSKPKYYIPYHLYHFFDDENPIYFIDAHQAWRSSKEPRQTQKMRPGSQTYFLLYVNSSYAQKKILETI